MVKTVKFVIGLGTGRCGTFSLYRLMQAQKGVVSSHEGIALPWEPDLLYFWRYHYRCINGQDSGCRDKKARMFFNVAFNWLPYVSEIMSHIVSPRCICLKRDRQEVIESFEGYMPTINHWTARDSKHWNPKYEQTGTSTAWPKYDLPRPEAIGAYWDYYYSTADYWENKFPDCFRIFPVDTLNSEKGVKAILKFAGVPSRNRVIHTEVKLNTRAKPKGGIPDPTLDENTEVFGEQERLWPFSAREAA